MPVFHVEHPVQRSGFAPTHRTRSRWPLVPVIGMLLVISASSAQAQFGKLKKMGADAIKDKAKEKIAGKEAAATAKEGAGPESGKAASSEAKLATMTLNASQLGLILAALTPMAADAEQKTQTKRLASDHARKPKLAEKCQTDATDAMLAKRIVPVTSEAAKTRARAEQRGRSAHGRDGEGVRDAGSTRRRLRAGQREHVADAECLGWERATSPNGDCHPADAIAGTVQLNYEFRVHATDIARGTYFRGNRRRRCRPRPSSCRFRHAAFPDGPARGATRGVGR